MKRGLIAILALLALPAMVSMTPATRAQGHDIQPDLRKFRQALMRHRPVYRFDSKEDYFPLRVNAITNIPETRLERQNGNLIAERREDGSGLNPFHHPHYILINLAVGGTNGGDPSATTFPAKLEVDYVRVYQKK